MSKVERINSAYLLNIMGIYLYNGEHMTGITQKVKEDDDEEVCQRLRKNKGASQPPQKVSWVLLKMSSQSTEVF